VTICLAWSDVSKLAIDMAELRPYVSKRQKKNETSKSTTSTLHSVTSSSAQAEQTVCSNKDGPRNQDNKDAICRTSNYSIPKHCVETLSSHKNAVNRIRWSCGLESDMLLSASMDGRISLFQWNKNSSSMARSIDVHSGAVKDARWSNDNECILSGGYDRHARITDVETGQEQLSQKFRDFVTSVVYHPTLPGVFLSGTSSNGIFAIDSKAGKEIHHYKSFFGQVQDLLFHPDSKIFFSAAEVLKRNSLDKAIIAWDFDTTAIMSNQISQEAFGCTCLQHHPTDSVFLAQYGSGYISIYSSTSPYKLNKYKRFEGHQTAGFNIGFSISPDGSCVVSGDREGAVHFYDYWSSRSLKILQVYKSACMDIAYHPRFPNVVASCSWDGEVSFLA